MFALYSSMEYGTFLLLGSNEGDAAHNLLVARKHIEERVGAILSASSLYRSAAWGLESQPDFINQVLQTACDHSAQKLLEVILAIESEMGRKRLLKWGPRLIDIDLLFYGDRVMNTPTLHLPHPGIPQRRFTLVPLAEIAPNLIHPVMKKTIATLLYECTDPLEVSRL